MERFRFVRGSDSIGDGMFLELWDEETQTELCEVFYSDETGQMTFTASKTFEIPLEVISRLLEQAHILLPPLEGRESPENSATLEP